LRLAPAASDHLAAVEDRLIRERARAEQALARLRTLEANVVDHETALLERDELRARVRALAEAANTPPPSAASPCTAVEEAPEPSQAQVRELLRPAELVAELGWTGGEQDLALPISQNVLDVAVELEYEWSPSAAQTPPAIAYLLPGLPPEGSGGSHSLLQEARGMRALGASARICVPSDALATAEGLYGNADELFVAYQSEDSILQAVGAATVIVSTEHTSVRLAKRIAEERPTVVCAYYVQDYEPLFAPPGSARSDHALLSYRAIPGQLLFAKTHWLRNVVMARHGVPVMKVQPSLDQAIFHARGRTERDRPVRVVAMVRPRTPRRRAKATLMALQAIARTLGEGVETFAFGCDAEAFAQLRARIEAQESIGAAGGQRTQAGASHAQEVACLGLLSRSEVAEVMRRTDVFIDASAYQAFGRSGLEAMACGAVPVLPAFGGVHEYAAHERDALIFEQDSPEAIAAAVCSLVGDRERLARLREAGLRSAARFSVERAARSQLGLFAAVTKSHVQPATVRACAQPDRLPIPS
jgi:glycosyltransferase involved in cell wall biosynthesis